MGRPDIIEDPRYATNAARMEHNDDMQAIVSEWVATQPRAEILTILDANDVVAAAVNDARDITEDAHFLERTLVQITDNPALGRVMMPGPILHVSSFSGPEYVGVPEIGEHTEEVLERFLGMSKTEITALAAEKIVTG